MTPEERALARTGGQTLIEAIPYELPPAAKSLLESAVGLAIDTLDSGHPDPNAAIDALRAYHKTELFASVSAALRARFGNDGA